MTAKLQVAPTGTESVGATVLPTLARMAARAGMSEADARRFWRIFDLLTRESLAHVPGTQRFSGICRDGSPWQYCVALGRSTRAPLRFLTEVGAADMPLRARTALTVERLGVVLDCLGTRESGVVDALTGIVPPDDDHVAALWVGLAAGAGVAPRLRIYANNGWGNADERWLRLFDALRRSSAGGFAAALQPHLPIVLRAFSPASLAIAVPASPPILKLYLRPFASPWSAVRTLASAVLGSVGEAFLARIERGLGQRLEDLPDRALLVSVSGSAAGGALDLKLDLCAHCLFDADARAGVAVQRMAASLGFDAAPYEQALCDLGWGTRPICKELLAFVGVGATAVGPDRINVYLTPTAPSVNGSETS